ncbi:MAG: DUF4129 domain-containing protein [Anaerolineae bacterium]|nr:DUF4129 domain-containing protein [Anaerolineae bacterium]NIN98345.1 DUF4129 domain-containing protein [Anaerolineae bacterium]NIQ81268.1 DUF4129 domain-containing protein [Anaerolineae bacterium]
MLLSGQRRGLIYFCLAGMEIAWITPFVALLFHQQGLGWSPTAAFGRLLAVLLVWVLALELMNRRELESPGYELAVVALVVVSTLVLVRILLYWGTPLGDFGWLPDTVRALFDFHLGLRPELVLILTNLLLWQRATNATSRQLDFFSVGVSFRLGILLFLLGGGLLTHVTGYEVTSLFWLYLALGLTAVAMARIREKATAGGSAGKSLPRRRLIQLLLSIALTVGAFAALALLFTPYRIKAVVAGLEPVWRVLGVLAQPLTEVLVWLIQIILTSMEWLLRRVMGGVDLSFLEAIREQIAALLSLAQRPRGEGLELPPWFLTGLRYAGVLLGILVMLGIVLLSLDKIRSRRGRDETEEESEEEITLGGNTLGRGIQWLREKAGLVRRFGFGRQLLAAISVQNMYANLCRLGGQRGYPRHPAQPPDDYLPVLTQAFGGQEDALGRITAAYMRVHYGDQPVSRAELARLRRDYDQVRRVEAETEP